MAISPQIFDAQVMHKRMFPRINAFHYRLYYLVIPFMRMAALADGWRFGVNRPGLMSFYARDHWDIEPVRREYALEEANGETLLVAMPRVIGYGFNPVCFWLLLDSREQLRAVIAEVHNTFGETHSYLCAHPDHRPLGREDELTARKLFHVSPFMERSGEYRFRFQYEPEEKRLGIWIDYYHEDGRLHLVTSLIGTLKTYNARNRRRIFWQVPLLSFKVIGLIHWQAIKLVAKRIAYVPKPPQNAETLSATANLTKSSSAGNHKVNMSELKR